MTCRVIHGDCTVVLRQMAEQCFLVDGVLCDPPYHLASIVDRLGADDSAPIQSGATGVYARSSSGFMGQKWDGGDIAFKVSTWRRVFDVLKPGGHLIAFAATKGYHRMVCAIEDAGFEIRDMIPWLYGTGFPKSHNLQGEHEGWGTGLKPAIEPVVLARKPIEMTSIPANMARYGTGAINIDACRIFTEDELRAGAGKLWSDYRAGEGKAYKVKRLAPGASVNATGAWKQDADYEGLSKPGRWPANLCHDGSDEVLAAFAAFGEKGAAAPVMQRNAPMFGSVYQPYEAPIVNPGATFHGDAGTAARFFYSSKATEGERIFECQECGAHTVGKPSCGHTEMRTHPTVKPIDLMRWYARMIVPAGGLILDPFAGTGTTGAACEAEGINCLMIEKMEEHVRDIGVRLGMPVADLIRSEVKALPTKTLDQHSLFE